MGLFDKIAEMFGRRPDSTPSPVPRAQKKPISRQVYLGPESTPVPEWAAELPKAKLMEACEAHAVCKFEPHIELKRIMSTRRGFDGNLETEYDGVAGGCAATKNFGMAVAKQDELLQPYRYVDLNHIYACCCDKFRRCPFSQMASGEAKEMQRSQRKF
jgi:hypothetical protein